LELRDYQQICVERLRAVYSAGKRAPLLVAPTGSGKTFCFAHMSKSAQALGNRVLIMVHRQELMRQASIALTALDLPHGLIAPGHNGENNQVAVASVQTLDRRLRRAVFNYDFVIIDECHHASAKTWGRVLAYFPQARLLGVTATPIRLDGRGLGLHSGGLFDELVLGPTIGELTARGYLVPAVVYAYAHNIDLLGVRQVAGDYSGRELAVRVNKPTITGSAVEHYARLAPGEPAIAFCASIMHAEHVAAGFRAAGISSEVIHGKLKSTERSSRLQGLASGRIQVLASVDLISEGTDIPVCSVAILLRPTASLGLYLQMVGRILRPSQGKTRGLVLDHVGNCLRHGLPDDKRQWSLDGVRKKTRAADAAITVRQCKKCFAVWDQGAKCPYCGHINIVLETRRPVEVEGRLEEITKEQLTRLKQTKKREYAQARTYAEVLALTRKFGDKPGYAFMYWNARMKRRG
jgi:DNA repair protein RadD